MRFVSINVINCYYTWYYNCSNNFNAFCYPNLRLNVKLSSNIKFVLEFEFSSNVTISSNVKFTKWSKLLHAINATYERQTPLVLRAWVQWIPRYRRSSEVYWFFSECDITVTVYVSVSCRRYRNIISSIHCSEALLTFYLVSNVVFRNTDYFFHMDTLIQVFIVSKLYWRSTLSVTLYFETLLP